MLRFLSPEHRPLAKPISQISHLASRISHLASRKHKKTHNLSHTFIVKLLNDLTSG
ncbi:hypothetical protein EDB71_101275 [Vibrio crassostreae]|nr:hypothetical protein EDB71_101275 [Vibrio crassostreae]